MVFRFVNPNSHTVIGGVRVVPDNPSDIDQYVNVQFRNTSQPAFVTVSGESGNIAKPFVMNPGRWSVYINVNQTVFLDYFVLLPEDFYLATILNQKVEKPCTIGERDLCRHHAYPNSTIYDKSWGAERGIIYCGKKVNIVINAFICDTPAKSFILGIKNHTGYFGCNKCIQEGDFIQNRLVFPELNSTLRTNLSFRNRTQPEHHLVSSELENLNIDMVLQFPLDYMHLICLGVMKKVLTFCIRGTLDVRIKKNVIPGMVQKSISLKVPKEFCRSPRSILELDRWKATEFRQFLLYTGIYILKDAVNKTLFEHFLCLSIAVRILSDKEHCKKLFYYAKELLHFFVKKFECYYGRHFMSYNVHNLLHICDDVENFGTLDMFSAFKYENYLYKLKLKLKDTSRPLCQIVNRITEENLLLLHSPQNVNYPYVKYKNGVAISVIFSSFCISLSEFNNVKLPLVSTQGITELDTSINDDKDLRERFTNYLKNIGGRNTKEMISRILTKLLKNSLGVQCSLLGKRNHLRFKDLKLMEVIITAVRHNFNASSESEIELLVGEWLRLSKLRISREK
ncbi:unnamed protein product [Psylliodes chrysocephalus]|uniref:DUF4806 domain-containing protein n=1 Tax=Psylliodes chrysocephalus TaxID=3402493 RepID=A0A9P0GH87_9CUCU|nr:unnamed protein product [Psylliodes chrysocephala]